MRVTLGDAIPGRNIFLDSFVQCHKRVMKFYSTR